MTQAPNRAYYRPLTECPSCDGTLQEALRILVRKRKKDKGYVKIIYYCLDCGRRHVARSERAADLAPYRDDGVPA